MLPVDMLFELNADGLMEPRMPVPDLQADGVHFFTREQAVHAGHNERALRKRWIATFHSVLPPAGAPVLADPKVEPAPVSLKAAWLLFTPCSRANGVSAAVARS